VLPPAIEIAELPLSMDCWPNTESAHSGEMLTARPRQPSACAAPAMMV
jgi:hypothetical protein